MVLLHGMCGSQRYWGAAFDMLAERCRLIVPDLLGFGASSKPLTGYGPDGYAAALAACLSEAGVDEPAIVVGHSMGTLAALALLNRHPNLVDSVIAIAPPVYQTRSDAVRHINAMNGLIRLMAFDPPARLLCSWMCAHRELAARLVPLLRPEMPGPIARDAVNHTWFSYVQSMEGLILSAAAPAWIRAATKPVDLVAALDDAVPDLVLLNELRAANPLVTLTLLPDGGHDLPLSRAPRCLALINRRVGALLAARTATGSVSSAPPPAPVGATGRHPGGAVAAGGVAPAGGRSRQRRSAGTRRRGALALGWCLTTLMAIAAVLISQGLLGPHDDTDLAYQRPGMLDLTTTPFRAPPSVAPLGAPTIVFFVGNRADAAAISSAYAADPAVAGDAQIRIVEPGPTRSPGSAALPTFSDPTGSLAVAFHLRIPRDGGPPLGYALVDCHGMVRYVTLDPRVTESLAEVRMLIAATG